MKITVMTGDERIISLDVDPQEIVENVKALLEVETQVPLQQQQLLYHGREARNNERLSSLGVVEGDLIMMTSTDIRTGTDNLGLNSDGSAVNPRALQQHIRNENSHLLSQLRQKDPEFTEAILGDNLDAFQNILRRRHQERLQQQRIQQEELALLNADPFDIDAQRKIEEMIRQRNVDENWENALEHNPESFARVVMLYVDMEVNGTPLKAFVDSGAQMTIISKSCAERCGLLRLLDKRYTGIARGVGQSPIVGRIHVAPIKVVETRFASNTIVLRRLVKVREALSSMVISHQWNTWRQSNNERAIDIRRRILDESWWSRAEYLLSFTEPILGMIRFTDMDKPCLGEVYDGIDSMIENMRSIINAKEQDPEETFFKEVQFICVERWNKMTTPLHLLAFSLSPKYYSEEILALPTRVPPYRDAEVGEGARKAISKLFPDIEMEDAVTSEFADFVSSKGHTLAAIRDKYRKDAHSWWYLNGHKSPNLQILAIKILSQIGTIYYPCTFTVLDSPDLEFIFGLDMLRKHQCEIDLKENVLRVGGGEVSVPFLQEKDIPGQFFDEEKFANQGTSASAELGSARKAGSSSTPLPSTGPSQANPTQGSNQESKIIKLMELGFDRATVIQALNLFNGNEEQAAGYLFGG